MSLVTWVGTPVEVARWMLRVAKIGSGDVVCDLGAGDGRILAMAVKDFGARRAIGYEIREDLCLAAELNARRFHINDRISMIRQTVQDADLSEVSVITLYLTSEANTILRPKLEKEVKSGTRIVSYLFPIRGWRATRQVDLREFAFRGGRFVGKLYLYRAPQSFSGSSADAAKDMGKRPTGLKLDFDSNRGGSSGAQL